MPLHDRHDGVITLFHFAGLPEHSGHLSSSNRGQWRQSVTDQPLRCGASTVTKSQDYRYYIEADQAWYYRTFVGRPGLDPGTLGFEPERTEASVVIRVAWSGDYASPLTSADVLSNLLPWLHDWLHRLGAGASGAVQVSGSDGLKIEVRVER
jgi:hypothetical protein